VTKIRYLRASEWGMTWTKPPVKEAMPDPEVYVHHVGGTAWMGEDAVQVFRDLNRYAQVGKGYSALDYDVLVHYSRRDDLLTIAEGRGPWMSAATNDRNEQGEAVCLCGNYSLREPLPIELEGVALGIVYGIEQGWIARNAVILGHRDNPAHPGATGCPGDFLYPKLPQIRARVDALLNPPKPAPKPTPSPSPAPVPPPPTDTEDDDMPYWVWKNKEPVIPPPTDTEDDDMPYWVWKNEHGGYCFGVLGEWWRHIGTRQVIDGVMATKPIDLATGRRVTSWAQVNQADKALVAKMGQHRGNYF